MGSAWIKAPGIRRTESALRRYWLLRRVSSVTQREVEAWVRVRRTSRYVETRSGQASWRRVISRMWVGGSTPSVVMNAETSDLISSNKVGSE